MTLPPSPQDASGEFFFPEKISQFFVRGVAKPTIILLYAALALSLWKYIPSGPGSLPGSSLSGNISTLTFPLFWLGERKIWAAFIIMGLIPVFIVKGIFREKLADYGIQWGNFFTLRSLGIMLPIMIVLGYLTAKNENFHAVYPFNPLVAKIDAWFYLHAVCYLFLYYAAWEFMFRGFMLRGLAPHTGFLTAILIQALAAGMLHYGHPLSEVLGSVGGSVFWGFLYFRTHSILSGWIQHAALGIVLDYFLILALTPTP